MKTIHRREHGLFGLLEELIYILFSIVEVLVAYLVDGLLLVIDRVLRSLRKQKKAHRYR